MVKWKVDWNPKIKLAAEIAGIIRTLHHYGVMYANLKPAHMLDEEIKEISLILAFSEVQAALVDHEC